MDLRQVDFKKTSQVEIDIGTAVLGSKETQTSSLWKVGSSFPKHKVPEPSYDTTPNCVGKQVDPLKVKCGIPYEVKKVPNESACGLFLIVVSKHSLGYFQGHLWVGPLTVMGMKQWDDRWDRRKQQSYEK